MKLRSLAVLLLTIVCAAPREARACEAMKPYLEDLAAGRRPASPPDATNCDKPDTAALAAALTAFIQKAPHDDIADVVEELKELHETREWKDAYDQLAAQVEKSIPYKREETRYDQLDNLADVVRPQAETLEPAQSKRRPPPKIAIDPPPAEPFPWLFWTFIAIAIVLVAFAAGLLVRLIRLTARQVKGEYSELMRRMTATAAKLDSSLLLVDEKLQTAGADLGAKTRDLSLLKAEHLASISSALSGMRDDIARLGHTVEDLATTPRAQTAADPVALEIQILAQSWKQFRGSPALSASFDDAITGASWESLLAELPKYIPADLQPSFDTVYAPCREHLLFVKRLALIPRIIDGSQKRLPTDAEELRRTRELGALLGAAQSTADGASPLNFRFKRWVTDTFLPFADLFLQRCQQAEAEKRNGELQTGAGIVRQLLQLASVEPIEVRLGEPFDSMRHIGRSTTNDPRYADGVITGVVRNGFIEGGQQVIRQPEVVVNRIR